MHYCLSCYSASQRKKAAAFVIENQDENVTKNTTVCTTEIAPEDVSLCPDLNIAANERNIKKSRKKQARYYCQGNWCLLFAESNVTVNFTFLR